MIKNLIILAVVIFGGMQAWEAVGSKQQPIFNEPYVAVYGRNTCSITQAMLKNLESSGINYHYYVIDEREVADSLHTRMRSAGIPTRRYDLPVVDTNGYMDVRPDIQDVLAKYQAGV